MISIRCFSDIAAITVRHLSWRITISLIALQVFAFSPHTFAQADRGKLAGWLTSCTGLEFEPLQAKLLAEALPERIAKSVLERKGPEYIDLDIECIILKDAPNLDSANGATSKLCVFSDRGRMSYLAITRTDASGWLIVWDTTLGALPGPEIQQLSLGVGRDPNVIILLTCWPTPSGLRSFYLIGWNGEVGRFVNFFKAIRLRVTDENEDGVAEIRTLGEDAAPRVAKDSSGVEAFTAEVLYTFDTSLGYFTKKVR